MEEAAAYREREMLRLLESMQKVEKDRWTTLSSLLTSVVDHHSSYLDRLNIQVEKVQNIVKQIDYSQDMQQFIARLRPCFSLISHLFICLFVCLLG